MDFWTDVGVGRNVDIHVSPDSLQSIKHSFTKFWRRIRHDLFRSLEYSG